MILLAAIVVWLIGFLLAARVTPCRAARDDGAAAARAAAGLSVVIPARNEADTLPPLLASLREQDVQPLEVLVVDDGSSDGTAAVAAAGGARVLPSAPLPAGWRGKTWACHQGAAAARGDLLLFMDADTRFEPGGLRRVLDTRARHGGVLSVAAWHAVERPYEDLSAFFNLMMVIGVGAFTLLGDAARPRGLFGPFLLTGRDDYQHAGGHAAVRGQVLEHLVLSDAFRRAGIPMLGRGGRGTLRIRMYPHGLRELAAGWGKAFAAGAARTPPWLLIPAVAWISGALLTAILAAAAAGGLPAATGGWVLLYLLFVLQLILLWRPLGAFRPLTALLYPVPLLFYLAVFTRGALVSARGGRVTWKGRDVPAAAADQEGGGTC